MVRAPEAGAGSYGWSMNKLVDVQMRVGVFAAPGVLASDRVQTPEYEGE